MALGRCRAPPACLYCLGQRPYCESEVVFASGLLIGSIVIAVAIDDSGLVLRENYCQRKAKDPKVSQLMRLPTGASVGSH